ncbi:hypothetical protein KDA06_02495 [Candidatus Saccharibacteria bacterium]|nr:hypothetical protein [Candidatus Saccharibacteria bacterium]
MKQIIWVFGTSAVGKETFMKAALNDAELQKALNLETQKIAISQESLRHLGALDGSRDTVRKDVLGLLKTNDAVFVKWQYGDTLLNTPNKLVADLPGVRHIAITLMVANEEKIKRLRTKSWWHDTGKESPFIAEEQRTVVTALGQLSDAFELVDLSW